MRNLNSKLCFGVALTLLVSAATRAQAVDTISIYEAYMSVILAIGGLLFGCIFVVLIICCCWQAATIRLQPRERRMWELKLPSGLTDDEINTLEKFNTEADAARRKKKKEAFEKPTAAETTAPAASTSAASSGEDSGKGAVSPSAQTGGRWATQSPGVATTAAYADDNVSGPNPYVHNEDDVVAFNESLANKFTYT